MSNVADELYIEAKLHTVSPEDSVQSAEFCMKTFRYRHLPVVADTGLVGIISDRDVAKAIALQQKGKQVSVGEFMTSPVVTVDRHESLLAAVHSLLDHRIGALIVVDAGVPVAVLSAIDMLRVLERLLAEPDKTVADAMSWHCLQDRDLVSTLSSIEYGC